MLRNANFYPHRECEYLCGQDCARSQLCGFRAAAIQQMTFITLWDYILLPIYILLIRTVAVGIRNRNYPPGHPWRPYFLPGLYLKMAGAVFISLVYQYYYGFGDTFAYFQHVGIINSAFFESPIKWFNLVFGLAKWYDPQYSEYISKLVWYGAPSNYIVCSAGALLGMFTFNKFLCIAVLMSSIAYTGQWALFRTFVKQYPQLTRFIAIACLFIPSVAIWGSGLFKDTICLFGLGWITYSVFQILIQRNFSFSNAILLLLSVYLVGVTKVYILIAFLPSIVLWVLLRYSYRIKYSFLRIMFLPIILGIVVFGFYYISTNNKELMGAYTTDQILERSEITREYILKSGDDESSSYTLGEMDNSFTGAIAKFPLAVNVTLFRPYLWEAKKPIVFFNALESFFFFFLFLKLIVRVGPSGIWRAISKDPNIQFFLIFSIIFAFAIGISTYNFGSLSRYRIPCLPTFLMAMGLIYYQKKDPKTQAFIPFAEKLDS